MTAAELEWIEVPGGYAVALCNGKVVVRGPRGHVLKSVPAALRDCDAVRQLRELRAWRTRRELDCLARVEAWTVRSLSVPMPVLQRLWAESAWRRALHDVVVVPLDASGRRCEAAAGFLRAVDLERGVGVVTLDGETVYSRAARVLLPHPVHLANLADYREFATELQVDQAVRQLYRETWTRPVDFDRDLVRETRFSGGRFAQLTDVTSRCRELGIRVSGRTAVTGLREGALVCEARYWIGSFTPYGELVTGDLEWVDGGGCALRVASVGSGDVFRRHAHGRGDLRGSATSRE